MLNDITVKNKLDSEEVFKISRFKEVIKHTKPHKHEGYFELIYLSEGAGFHWIDTEKLQITPPVVFFLSGQLHYWEMTAIPKGYVMIFREDFFIEKNLLHHVHALEEALTLHPSNADNLDHIFEEMEKEYQNRCRSSADLIRGYLQVAVIKLLRHKEIMNTGGLSAVPKAFRQFQQFIRSANPISNLKVSEVAEHLGISPQNLTTLCRKISGKSASELIVEQVVLEAKRYLLHSDKNVSEIGIMLNFADPSHFVKYFKKMTGETPQVFRRRHLKNTMQLSNNTM